MLTFEQEKSVVDAADHGLDAHVSHTLKNGSTEVLMARVCCVYAVTLFREGVYPPGRDHYVSSWHGRSPEGRLGTCLGYNPPAAQRKRIIALLAEARALAG